MAVYEKDFYAWSQEQATLLKVGDFSQLDTTHLIEEIEAMGRAERRQLINRLEVLLLHLLKWQFQPALRSRSWRSTIAEQRRRIRRLLRDNPSLQPELPPCLADAYEDARYATSDEAGLALVTFPATCPYPLAQVVEPEWLPA